MTKERTKQSPADKLAKLKEKNEKLQAQIQLLENKEKTKLRKQETRLKILFGAYLLDEIKKDEHQRKVTEKNLLTYLTKERDQTLVKEYFDGIKSA